MYLGFFDLRTLVDGGARKGQGDVNAATGGFNHMATDAMVGMPGSALKVTRASNSRDDRVGGFGTGWSFDYDMAYKTNSGGDVSVVFGDGHREVFTHFPDGSYRPALSGYWSTLVPRGGGGCVLTQKDRTAFAFNSAGKLLTITDRNGFKNTMAYNASGKLATVTASPSGRSLTFTWVGERVTAVSTDTVAAYGRAMTWTYTYTGGLLTKVCKPRDNTPNPALCVTYTYAGNRLAKSPAANASH